MNEHLVRKQAQANARLAFLRALGAGQVHVLDRFGVRVEPGMKMLFSAALPLVVEVQAVQPDLAEDAPPGQMILTLALTMPLVVGANQPFPAGIVMGGPQGEHEIPDEKAGQAAQDALQRAIDRIGADGGEAVKSGPTGLVDGTGRSLDEPPL